MSWKQFVVLHEGVMRAQQLYIESLPTWVQLWMNWMAIVFGSALFFAIWKDEARIVLVAVILSLFVSYWIGWFLGWNRLWSAAHLLCWPPALYFLVKWWPSMEFRPQIGGRVREWTGIFKAWGAITIATMGISLAFDFVDVIRYFVGNP